MGSGGIAHTFLTLALDGGEWSAHPSCFSTREGAPGIHWIGSRRLGGLQSWSRCREKFLSLLGIKPQSSSL